jgi:hypothetical protein
MRLGRERVDFDDLYSAAISALDVHELKPSFEWLEMSDSFD